MGKLREILSNLLFSGVMLPEGLLEDLHLKSEPGWYQTIQHENGDAFILEVCSENVKGLPHRESPRDLDMGVWEKLIFTQAFISKAQWLADVDFRYLMGPLDAATALQHVSAIRKYVADRGQAEVASRVWIKGTDPGTGEVDQQWDEVFGG